MQENFSIGQGRLPCATNLINTYHHRVSQQPLPNQNICPVKDKKAIFIAYLFSFLVSLINCSKGKSIFCVCVKWKKGTKLALMAPQMLSWNALTEQRARQRNSGFKHHQEQADIIYTSTCLKGKQQTHSTYSEEAFFFPAILSISINYYKVLPCVLQIFMV